MLQDMTYITFHCRYGQISIHRGCIEKTGYPDYVQLLVNLDTHQLILRRATANERDAFAVPQSIYERKATFGINGEMLIKKFIDLMNWQKNSAYRVDGALTDDLMMLFDLNAAVPSADWHENMITSEDELVSNSYRN